MKHPTPAPHPLAQQVNDRARDLYHSRQALCSEAVLVAVDDVFRLGLGERQAMAMASALPVGLGGSGCLCGAVSGAATALGLGLSCDPAPCARGVIRAASARLHDDFKARFGSTCCRVLTRKLKDDRKAHFAQCEELTAMAAQMVTELLLENRPDMALRAEGYTPPRPTLLGSMVSRVRTLIGR